MAQKEFRKPPRYMVGDIVYSHGFICIVCSIYPFNIDYSYDLKVIDGQSLGKICQNDIMHVHIWEEFLKKNGWRTQNRWYYYLDVAEGFISYIGIDFKHKSNKGHLYVEVDGNNMVEIQYCHELQHFLFGLGINHKMEV